MTIAEKKGVLRNGGSSIEQASVAAVKRNLPFCWAHARASHQAAHLGSRLRLAWLLRIRNQSLSDFQTVGPIGARNLKRRFTESVGVRKE